MGNIASLLFSNPQTTAYLTKYFAIALGCNAQIVEALLRSPAYQPKSMAQIWQWMQGQPCTMHALSTLLAQCGWQLQSHHWQLQSHYDVLEASNGAEKIALHKSKLTLVYHASRLWGYKLMWRVDKQQQAVLWNATGWVAIGANIHLSTLDESGQDFYSPNSGWLWALAERTHCLAAR
jgi:hypothetical protein